MCDAKAAVSLTAPAVVVAGAWALSLPIWPTVTLSILAAGLVGCAVLYRVLRYGRSMRPVRVRAEVQRAALPSPRKAIEAAPVHGTVLTPAEYARIRSAR